MKYTLMFYLSTAEFAARTDPKQKDAFWGSFMPYLKAVKDSGIFAGGAGLEPPDTATTVRLRDGKRLVQDGPYADTKEQLGGFLRHRCARPRQCARLGSALSSGSEWSC